MDKEELWHFSGMMYLMLLAKIINSEKWLA